MAKIILGKRPEAFVSIVKFPMLDGSDGRIRCEFKYRTKTEFGKLIDSIVDDARKLGAADVDADKPEDKKLADLMGQTVAKNADYLMDVLKGWDVPDHELTRDNCAELCDALPGAASAIMEAYRIACTEGRVGN